MNRYWIHIYLLNFTVLPSLCIDVTFDLQLLFWMTNFNVWCCHAVKSCSLFISFSQVSSFAYCQIVAEGSAERQKDILLFCCWTNSVHPNAISPQLAGYVHYKPRKCVFTTSTCFSITFLIGQMIIARFIIKCNTYFMC